MVDKRLEGKTLFTLITVLLLIGFSAMCMYAEAKKVIHVDLPYSFYQFFESFKISVSYFTYSEMYRTRMLVNLQCTLSLKAKRVNFR